MKILSVLILFAIIITISQTTVYAQLSYAEGGPSVEDPGLNIAPSLRRYIDSKGGNDSNNGQSPAAAWKTLKNISYSLLVPGMHILFKRGGDWSGIPFDFKNHSGGSEGHRIVFGAYGDLNDPRPILEGVRVTNYFMVRDLEAKNFSVLYGHYSTIYNNVCHGSLSNGITAIAVCDHIVIMGNLIYDIALNDCITLHAAGWFPYPNELGSHHWIIDNITIGRDGTEEGVDMAMGNYTKLGVPMEGDVKVVANRIQSHSVPGLSKFSGRGVHGIGIGYDGQWTWVVGNTVVGGRNHGISLGGVRKYFNVSGNIVFNGSETSMINLAGLDIDFEYNTMYDIKGISTTIWLNKTGLIFNKNIILRPDNGGYWVQEFENPGEMDYNWWGHSESPIMDGKSFTQWQTTTGYDLHSGLGPVAGFSDPVDNAYNHDPRNWRDQAFLDQFMPSSDFVGLDGTIPGAFDKNGKRQGMAILPFEGTDLENGGLGWEGPPMVQQRLRELGISWGEPILAKYPSPKDRSINVGLDTDLSWEAGDSTISHDVYFGTKSDSLIFMGNQNDTIFNSGTLVYETVYYWRVDQVTVDSTVTGTLWSFTTKEEPIPPAPAENPNPGDGSVDQRTSLLLSWDPGKRTRSVKIYLGTVSPPPLVMSIEGNSYNFGDLELNTKYYWRVDGVNEWGETEGTVWEFTTKSVPDLPEGWASLDIGEVATSGTDIFENNSFVVTASGSGIKETADQFRFVYHSLNGDGSISARVESIDNTNPMAMAGVMIREKLDSTSIYNTSALTPEKGIRAQWRKLNGAITDSKVGSIVAAPYWVKLVRAGNYFVSYGSSDGQTWETIKTEQINMQSDVYMGLAVTSGTNDSLCTAVFDNVSINGVIVSVEDEESGSILPKEFVIGNYPNPFNPTTTIKYDLPKSGDVKIQIYDIKGSLVEELLNSKQNAGSHSVIWNGKNSQGVQTSSGIYLYKVHFNDQIKTAKMILLK